MAHRWLILGSGGHGRSVADAIRAQGDAVVGFLDDSHPADELVAGVPVIGLCLSPRSSRPCHALRVAGT